MISEPQKHFMRFLIAELRNTHHQLLANIVVGRLAEEAGFPYTATLQKVAASTEIQRRADKWVEGLDELVDEMDDSTHDRLIQEYLAKHSQAGDIPN